MNLVYCISSFASFAPTTVMAWFFENMARKKQSGRSHVLLIHNLAPVSLRNKEPSWMTSLLWLVSSHKPEQAQPTRFFCIKAGRPYSHSSLFSLTSWSGWEAQMLCCCVQACQSCKNRKSDKSLSFHQFLKDKQPKEDWNWRLEVKTHWNQTSVLARKWLNANVSNRQSNMLFYL